MVRSLLSTSISRRPLAPYSCSNALTNDDLPVPRDPVSRTLLAGRPARNCSVLRTSLAVWLSTAARRDNGKVCGAGRLSKVPLLPAFCQRNAAAFQSGSRVSGGSQASRRFRTDSALRKKDFSFMLSSQEMTKAGFYTISKTVDLRYIHSD